MKYLVSIVCLAVAFLTAPSRAQSAFSFGYSGGGTSVAVGASNGYGAYSGAYAGSGFYPVTYTGYCGPTTWPFPAQVPVAATTQQMAIGAPAYFTYPQPIVPYYPVWTGGCAVPVVLPNCR